MTVMIPAWVNGKLQPIEKLAAHQRGLRHKAVSVFVIRDGKVLLQRRALGKYHTPGLWANTCCTHPDWGEDAQACAVRRLREELGIVALTPAFRTRLEYRADVGGGLIEHELVDVFCATAPDSLTLSPNPDEVSDIRWAALDRLADETRASPERFTPWLRIYMQDHLATIFDDQMFVLN